MSKKISRFNKPVKTSFKTHVALLDKKQLRLDKFGIKKDEYKLRKSLKLRKDEYVDVHGEIRRRR